MSSFDGSQDEQARQAVDSFLDGLAWRKKQREKEGAFPAYCVRYMREKYGERVWSVCGISEESFAPVGQQYLPYKTDDRSSDRIGSSSVNSNLCAFFGSGYTSQITWARVNGFFTELEEDYAIQNGDFKNCW